jgi:hypothetical protein
MLRNMGSNRTRGFGEVECQLIDEPYPLSEVSEALTFRTFDFGDKKCAPYRIRLDEPVISAKLSGGEGCESFLPGSMLMGWFAGQWNQKKQREDEEEFKRIFLKGEVIFTCAYPGGYPDDARPFYTTPFCMKKDKADTVFHDASVCDNDEATRAMGGFSVFGEDIKTISVSHETAQHHARPYDRAVGHSQLGGGDSGGAFYSYESLLAGQYFYGSIIGAEEDLQALASLAQPVIRLGRSCAAQYGNASFDWVGAPFLEHGAITVNPGESVRVLLRSPLILRAGDGTARPDAEILAAQLGLHIEREFCSEEWIGGYSAKWLLPRTQLPALSMGSVIKMKNESGADITLGTQQFAGLRTGIGFGHISIEKMPAEGKLEKPINTTVKDPKTNAGGLDLSDKILRKKEIQKKRQIAQDNIKITNSTPANAQLGRLIGVLSRNVNPVNSIDDLRNELRDDGPVWKDGKKRKSMQEFCRINDTEFISYDWELYKAWLMAAIRKVRQDRRGTE